MLSRHDEEPAGRGEAGEEGDQHSALAGQVIIIIIVIIIIVIIIVVVVIVTIPNSLAGKETLAYIPVSCAPVLAVLAVLHILPSFLVLFMFQCFFLC